jgi:hypothetical protein
MKRRSACFIVRDHSEPRGKLQKLGLLAAGTVVCRRQMLSYNQKDLNSARQELKRHAYLRISMQEMQRPSGSYFEVF